MVSESIIPGVVPEAAEQEGASGSDPARDTEKTALLAWLDEQREHVLGILEGLDEEALRRPVLPSGWSCLAMVQHLTGMERFWFRAIVAGEQAVIDEVADETNEWVVAPEVTATAVFDVYRRERALANAIIVATPLDQAPAWWPEGIFGDWRLHSLRDILLHVLTETACHCGHLDAARELIDGRQWLVLTE